MRNGKPIRILIVILLIVVAVIVSLLWYVRLHEFRANTPPSSVEAFVATRLRRLAVPTHARELQNPVPSSPEAMKEAMEHFADHCATCHGNDGSGRTHIGAGLYPPPPDMALAGTQQLSDGELYYIIENGVRFTGMPAFGEKQGDEQDEASWKLVHFIRHLPMLTDDEAISMKATNPKTPGDIANEERIQKFLQGDETVPADTSPTHHH